MSGEITREEAEEWEDLRMKAWDHGSLISIPREKEQMLWDAVAYLSGVALQNSPNVYFDDLDGIKLKSRELTPFLRWY